MFFSQNAFKNLLSVLSIFVFVMMAPSVWGITVQGKIENSAPDKIKIFGCANAGFTGVFDETHVTVSLPVIAGQSWPTVAVTTSFLPSLPVSKWFVLTPFVENGRVFYTFVGVVPDMVSATWPANQNCPMLELTFSGGGAGYTTAARQLNDLTASGGGQNGQAFWYVQLLMPTAVDATNYPAKFYGPSVNNSQTGNSWATASAALPIELAQFTARETTGGAVQLDWATASEKNADRFEIERSADGWAWESIGESMAVGESTELQNYGWLDAGAAAVGGELFYRLRMIDADGSAEFSNISAVRLAAAVEAAVFPNPSTGVFSVSAASATEGEWSFDIFSPSGQLVKSGSLEAAAATEVDLTDLATGVYVVAVKSEGRTVRQLKALVLPK